MRCFLSCRWHEERLDALSHHFFTAGCCVTVHDAFDHGLVDNALSDVKRRRYQRAVLGVHSFQNFF